LVNSSSRHSIRSYQNSQNCQLHIQATHQQNYHLRIFFPPSLLHGLVQIGIPNRICNLYSGQHHILPYEKFRRHIHRRTNRYIHVPLSTNPLLSASQILILSDSLSSLLVIKDPYSTNPIVQPIHILIHSLTSSVSSVSFLWISGHIDLEEYDAVYLAVKRSLLSPTTSMILPPPPLTISNPITAPSSYPLGMISGLPYFLTRVSTRSNKLKSVTFREFSVTLKFFSATS